MGDFDQSDLSEKKKIPERPITYQLELPYSPASTNMSLKVKLGGI